MSFSSAVFLLLLMPVAIGGYLMVDEKYKNGFVCVISILFYAWSGVAFLLLAMFSTFVVYVFGIYFDAEEAKHKKGALVFGLIYSLGVLFYFKYFAGFARWIIDCLDSMGANISLNVTSPALPLGISFYTFSILSYLLDVYWGKNPPQKRYGDLLLYVLLYPKAISGPIMRYSDFAGQLKSRPCRGQFFQGMEKFVKGLVKKILFADQLLPVVEYAFGRGAQLDTVTAWVGIICFLLQLYYDFSGYSDMAVGLGLMMGFRLPTNFDHPYMSRTVAEYWRRWHISLGEWFKNYVYTPAARGFMKLKNPITKKRLSVRAGDICGLLVTWVLCGFWHGAGIRFLLYGLWYYMFIALERAYDYRVKRLKKRDRTWREKPFMPVVQHLFTFFAVIVGQTIFQSSSMGVAAGYIKRLFVWNFTDWSLILLKLSPSVIFALLVGMVFCFPVYDRVKDLAVLIFCSDGNEKAKDRLRCIKGALLLAAYILMICYVAGSQYKPFLYAVF